MINMHNTILLIQWLIIKLYKKFKFKMEDDDCPPPLEDMSD